MVGTSRKFAGEVALGETVGGSCSGLTARVHSLDLSSFSGCLIKNKNCAQLKIKSEPRCLVQAGLGVKTDLWVHSPCCVRTLVPVASGSAGFQPGLGCRARVPLPAATEMQQEKLH